ncbi:Carbohydrate binding module (family 6) [Nocardioides exalbidus]|uniref:Carbohydrate binding module (Family 6) n=1 Tax=Nocardioides exalbidus TaxID=402596 RepID=A0A1H4K703_9ACTN|nr:family 16 glycoside hydrolase [Nocardioides exalbidus]SEB54086.1 Carbohydrate binding module (family 6) [Nocardioides exalbidus]
MSKSPQPARGRIRAIAAAVSGVLVAGVGVAAIAVPPGDEPGVTMRAFQLGQSISSLCTIKAAQTPNVDQLKPTVDWSSPADFGGLQDNFLVHVLANLTIDTAGTYMFRLISDDGSELLIDDELVVDHDGLHGDTAMDGSVTLASGVHSLRINYFEATNGERLTLQWRKPGETAFTLVPSSVLSTEADVTRVTAPGFKQCEGQDESAGDGLQLDSVNPAYTLTDLRPQGFEPQVTGLGWDGDDLLVLTWGGNGNDQGNVSLGELHRLSGVRDAASPADVTRVRVAEGLKEPQGITVVDGDVYVSEKTGLVRLVDADADGVFEGKDVIATYPFDGNFHEFGFGMLYADGKFHLNLSVSINLGGATTVPQGSHHRGTHITVDKETGAIDYVAGGLRTPHGMGWGPEGEIFVTDNQGGWLPANKLIQIKPGEFYNHFTTGPDGTPGEFDDQPVTQPVLWMPQNEIANSPSTPIMVEGGPYAGQMFIGDVTYGGLQRADLEKVGGSYQGALFRSSQGLEAGVSRVLAGEDGQLIVGGLGAGGNWGQTGKLRYGLQKLDLNGTVPFDMLSMDVVEGGFEIEYTKPLSAETLAGLADAYQLKQWRYRPTAQYGGPKLNEETLEVTSSTASPDGRTVRLAVAGMKPGRVVHLRSPRPFSAASGETLWSTEAWYTLNTYPGYVEPEPEPAPFGLYELEDGELLGGASIQTEHEGYSGSGFVAGMGDVGSGTEVQVVVDEAGTYDVTIGYANGPNPSPDPVTKTLSMFVNGERTQIGLPPTGSWKTWGTHTVQVDLPAGPSTLRLEKVQGDDGHVNLDYAQVLPPTSTRYEAEAAARSGGAAVQTEHAGFSGSGYVGGMESAGAKVTFTVDAAEAGEHALTLGYANGPHPSPNLVKTLDVSVNGGAPEQLSLPNTGAWNQWSTVVDSVELAQGSNTISYAVPAANGPTDGRVNLDYLDVGAAGVTCDPDQPVSPDDEFDGDRLDTCRWTTILNPAPGGLEVRYGTLRISAQSGDLSGGAVSARNMVLQPAPADGVWAATTEMSLSGTDDYLQGGLVAHTSNDNYAKLVAMRTPQGQWVLELGRRIDGQMVYSNSPPLAGAPNRLLLQMASTGTAIQGRWSVDGGTTWQSMGAGYPADGLVAPRIGVAAYNGTGSEVGVFERFTVTEPVIEPDTCEATEADPGYRMLFDGTQESLAGWNHAGPGFFTREADCTLMTNGGLGLLWHSEPLEDDYSLQLDWKLVKDDNAGVFVGFPDPGDDPWVGVDQGYEIQIDATDLPDRTTGAIYTFQGADQAARDAALHPVGQWNHYEIRVEGKRIRVYLNDTLVNDFTSPAAEAGRLTWPSYFGLQNHGNGENVYFRDVQLMELDDPEDVPATVTVTAPAEVETGKTATVEVEVTSQAQSTPTGEVTLTVDGEALAPVDLEDGTATFEVGPVATEGTVSLAAAYAGDVAHEPGQGSTTMAVKAPAGPTTGPTPTTDPGPTPQQPQPTTPVGPVGPTPSVGVGGGGKVDAVPDRRRASVVLQCGATDCEGRAVLRTKGGKKLGAGAFDLDAREKRKVVVKLNARARALLDRRKVVGAVLVVRFEDGPTQRLRVRLKR